MSSENDSYASTPPRIRQFGLYKGIDCRTEEFLRLSRRRQIRQGCACAAVSTAITVTVVIVVIFIYEFSFNSEVAAVRTKLRPNWFSFINDTTEDSFDKRFTKSNIEKTSLTFLPILINALKKNVFLEKIFEEQSSSRPNTESSETTEYSIDKDVFTKNLFRNPSSIFAISYKTFPIDYTRATTNQAYFTKIRKIRDYQRIFNYFDKMINDKAYLGISKPMGGIETVTDKMVTNKQKAKKYYHKSNPKIQELKQVPRYRKNQNKGEYDSKDCKCMVKLGNILHRFLSVIQLLLPQASKKLNGKFENDFVTEPLNEPINELDFEPINEPDKEHVKYSKTNVKDSNYVESYQRKPDYTDRIYRPDENGVNIPALVKTIQKQKNIKNNKDESSANDNDNDSLDSLDQISNQKEGNTFDLSTQSKPLMNYKYNKLVDHNSIINFFNKNNEMIHKQMPEIKIFHVDDVYPSKNMDGKNFDLIREEAVNRLQHMNRETFRKQSAGAHTTTNYPQMTKLPIHTLIKSLNKTIYQLIKNNNIQQIAVDENLIQPHSNRSKLSIDTKSRQIHQDWSQEQKPLGLIKERKGLVPIHKPKDIKPIYKKDAKKDVLTKKHNDSGILQKPLNEMNSTSTNKTKTSKSNENVIKSSYSPNTINGSVHNISTKKPDIGWEDLNNENIPAYKSITQKHRPIFLEIQQKSDWKQDHDDDYNILNNYDFST